MTSATSNVLHREQCPVCQSTNIYPLFIAEDHTVSHESFPIWECGQCQLRFTQDIPDESHIGPYYQSEEYISHSNTSQGLINQLYQRIRKITLTRKRKQVVKLSKRDRGSLLDIGCGTGDFAGTMQEAGWKVYGLEPDAHARRMASERHRLEVSEPDSLFALEPEQFDVITMWHVLEHVHRLHAYLDQMRKLLKPGGTLLIAVPNYQSSDAAHYGEKWAAYDVPRHLYHFSPSTMAQLVGQHEFHVERHLRMPFDTFYVSLPSEKYLHVKPRLFAAAWQGWRSFLEGLAQPQRGSSILYVIRPE